MSPSIHPSRIPSVRQWHGRALLPHEATLMFHERAGPLCDTLDRLNANLSKAGIDYVVIWAFALGCHHYCRATNVTIDLLVSDELAGRTSRNKLIRFPDPPEAVGIEGLRTRTLPRLVELKLVTWRYKDWQTWRN